MYNIPTVLEGYGTQQRAWDLYSRLLESRHIFIAGEVRDENMGIIFASILHLEHQDPEKPIYFYINSPGGNVQAGLQITDLWDVISSPIVTICTGMAASMGSIFLSHKVNRPGSKRMILPNARVMCHQVSSSTQGVVQDQQIALEESIKINDTLMGMLANNTGKTKEEIKAMCSRDKWFSAQEAVDYGLVDEIYTGKNPTKFSTSPVI